MPVLKFVAESIPAVDTITFGQMGPLHSIGTSETLPYFLIWELTNFTKATWNFSESGHDKGPGDGIGGVTNDS